jgi:hypothetical protein
VEPLDRAVQERRAGRDPFVGKHLGVDNAAEVVDGDVDEVEPDWLNQHDGTVRRVLTDNAMSYRRRNAWAAVCSALQVKRRFIKPVLPLDNGKAERSTGRC